MARGLSKGGLTSERCEGLARLWEVSTSPVGGAGSAAAAIHAGVGPGVPRTVCVAFGCGAVTAAARANPDGRDTGSLDDERSVLMATVRARNQQNRHLRLLQAVIGGLRRVIIRSPAYEL